MPPPSAASPSLLRTLYRSLLRSSKPFSIYPVWASLLHRSSTSHDWHECIYRLEQIRNKKRRDVLKHDRNGEDDRQLPQEWARNLSRSYNDLKEEYALRLSDFYRNRYPDDDATAEDSAEFINMAVGSSNYITSEYERNQMMYGDGFDEEDDPKAVLYRHLFREYMSGGDGCHDAVLEIEDKRKWTMDEEGFIQNGKVRAVPVMRWPCLIEEEDGSMSLREMIRREFRAPTVEQRVGLEADGKEVQKARRESESVRYFPPSSYIDNHIRVQTAFHALMELNRKLVWGAEILGLVPHVDPVEEAARHRKRLLQAAKGVSLFPNTSSIEQSLRCGTYLIAHPLMTGYFSRSVIIILDHSTSSSSKKEKKHQDDLEIGPGGTYGLIVNRLALQPISQEKRLEILRSKLEEKMSESGPDSCTSDATRHSSTLLDIMKPTSSVGSALQRPISLLQAVQPNHLPESVQDAFGNCAFRDGGPVNFSMQMLHRKCQDSAKSVNGQNNDSKEQVNSAVETMNQSEKSKDPNDTEVEIGGVQIPTEDDCLGTDAIYFGGDVVKASLSVLDGSADQADFSFIVGASCWTPGQLQREIERGCWLPFLATANIAMTGMCEHNDVLSSDIDMGPEKVGEKTKLSMYPPRPSNSTTLKPSRDNTRERPSSDLWLSIMCALGKGEGELAYALLDEKKVLHELGDTCDNFDRK
ncbi:hypothetical protein ACHAXN_006744 [Cyclotella atomus]